MNRTLRANGFHRTARIPNRLDTHLKSAAFEPVVSCDGSSWSSSASGLVYSPNPHRSRCREMYFLGERDRRPPVQAQQAQVAFPNSVSPIEAGPLPSHDATEVPELRGRRDGASARPSTPNSLCASVARGFLSGDGAQFRTFLDGFSGTDRIPR